MNKDIDVKAYEYYRSLFGKVINEESILSIFKAGFIYGYDVAIDELDSCEDKYYKFAANKLQEIKENNE